MDNIRLSWSRDDEGVITIYATDENTGRIAEVADFWTRPLCERLGFRREYAKGVQQQLAETLVWNWNGPPGGEPGDDPDQPSGDYHEGIAEGWKAGAEQERRIWTMAIETYFDATAVMDVENYVEEIRKGVEGE